MQIQYETELYHHGIKGQKWGVRRFQNADGTLTGLGRTRAAMGAARYLNKMDAERARSASTERKAQKKFDKANAKWEKKLDKAYDKEGQRYTWNDKEPTKKNQKRAAKEEKKLDKLYDAASKEKVKRDAAKANLDAATNKRKGMENVISAQTKQLGKEGFIVKAYHGMRPTITPTDAAIAAVVFGVPGVVLATVATVKEGDNYKVY